MSEEYTITIEVKRTADGRFLRVLLDGVEVHDMRTMRDLARTAVTATFKFLASPLPDDPGDG